jgi:hypothetical protein
MSTNRQFPNPSDIAALGEKIYNEKYRDTFEPANPGKYVAIDVRSAKAFLGDTPEQAIERGRTADRGGLFHLIRVGFPSVYSGSSQVAYGRQDWIFGR